MDGPVVVKVAPAGLEPVRNRDVLRQARVLRALRDTGVPVPEVRLEDAGAPPDVPPLFVTSFVAGSSFEPMFDVGDAGDPDETLAQRLFDAARVLAQLHRLDPGAIGLDDEPPSSLADEVARWSRALDTVDAHLVPGWREVAAALVARAPAAMGPSVLHGDFRLGNCLSVGPVVAAVIDWEIWSVGDPRVDLGWFLLNADAGTYARRGENVALPSPGELAAAYRAHLGRDVPEVDVFRALACFKSAATWGLIVKHARRRATGDPLAEEMAPALARLLERAAVLLGRA